MERLTTTDYLLGLEMICKYDNCWTDEEHCPHINTENCQCLQNILMKLKKYEDTGLTPEQIHEIDEMFRQQAKELIQYREIGTVKDFIVSKRKQESMRVIDNTPVENPVEDSWYQCPSCRGDLTKVRSPFCPYCGKKLDWREANE